MLSVCTRALLLAKAGLLDGLEATTHHGAIELLRQTAPQMTVHPDRRFVDNGRVVCSAGIAALGSEDRGGGPGRESLEQFLAKLRQLWQEGEARPTHGRRAALPHDWRTRKDPFEGVWSEVLLWLQENPEAAAKSLFERLGRPYPDRFPAGQLPTLQRRVRQWRRVMARELVYACVGAPGAGEKAAVIGANGGAESPSCPCAAEGQAAHDQRLD